MSNTVGVTASNIYDRQTRLGIGAVTRSEGPSRQTTSPSSGERSVSSSGWEC